MCSNGVPNTVHVYYPEFADIAGIAIFRCLMKMKLNKRQKYVLILYRLKIVGFPPLPSYYSERHLPQ